MLKVYTQEFCPKCTELKEALKESHIEFTECDVSADHKHRAFLLFHDIDETPVVEYNGKVIKYDDNIDKTMESILKVLKEG